RVVARGGAVDRQPGYAYRLAWLNGRCCECAGSMFGAERYGVAVDDAYERRAACIQRRGRRSVVLLVIRRNPDDCQRLLVDDLRDAAGAGREQGRWRLVVTCANRVAACRQGRGREGDLPADVHGRR